MIEFNRKEVRTWSMLGARGTFGKALYELATERQDFMVVTADLEGSSGLKRFGQQYPEQLLNVGIAEQNLIGIAAGIAREGIPTFATSFAPFIALRSGEQIRIDMAYMQTPVIAVGIGSGMAMGYLGNTHYGLEDMAVMKAIPEMTVLNPADGMEIVKCVYAALDYGKPIYLRLTGTSNLPIVYKEDYSFQIGKAVVLKEGKDVAIFAIGSMVSVALKVAELMEENYQVYCHVINIHTIKPLDEEAIVKYARQSRGVVTMEEHSIQAGLADAVGSVLANHDVLVRQLRVGLPDAFLEAAEYTAMLNKYGLTAEAIQEKLVDWLG